MYIGKTLIDTIQCTKREDTVNSPKAVTAEITMYLLTEIVAMMSASALRDDNGVRVRQVVPRQLHRARQTHGAQQQIVRLDGAHQLAAGVQLDLVP